MVFCVLSISEDIFITFSFLPQLLQYPTLYPPNSCPVSIFIKENIKRHSENMDTDLSGPTTPETVACSLCVVNVITVASLKKTDFTSLRSYCLLIASCLGAGLCIHFPFSMLGFFLALAHACLPACILWILTCCVWKNVVSLKMFTTSGSYNLSTLS